MSSRVSSTGYRNLRALGDNARFARHNHAMGVASGGFGGLAQNFLQPEMILGGLIYAVTGSAVWAAAVPVVNKLVVMGPQLLVGSLLEHLPRRRPAFIITTVVRVGLLVALVGSIWRLALGVTTGGLALFFAVYAAFCVSSAFGHLIFLDMTGRLIPAHRLGSFLGTRNMLGGAGSVVAGFLIIQPILAVEDWSAATPYAILAAIGTLLVAIDMGIWCNSRERPGVSAKQRTSFPQAIRRGFGWLRTDRNYRCYLGARVAFRINYVGLALFIPYGTERLGYERAGAGGLAVLGGILVGVLKLSNVVGSYLWGRVVDRRGSRITMVRSAGLLLGAVALALLAPELPATFALHVPGLRQAVTLPLVTYVLGLGMLGMSISGTMIGGWRYLITHAPPHRRPSYVGFPNTLTTPLTLLPMAAAWFAETFGMFWVFVFVGMGATLGLASVWLMDSDDPTAEAAG